MPGGDRTTSPLSGAPPRSIRPALEPRERARPDRAMFEASSGMGQRRGNALARHRKGAPRRQPDACKRLQSRRFVDARFEPGAHAGGK
jgi:hypothetical protein